MWLNGLQEAERRHSASNRVRQSPHQKMKINDDRMSDEEKVCADEELYRSSEEDKLKIRRLICGTSVFAQTLAARTEIIN